MCKRTIPIDVVLFSMLFSNILNMLNWCFNYDLNHKFICLVYLRKDRSDIIFCSLLFRTNEFWCGTRWLFDSFPENFDLFWKYLLPVSRVLVNIARQFKFSHSTLFKIFFLNGIYLIIQYLTIFTAKKFKSVQEFVKIKSWLLLIFSICLYNQ